MNHDAPQHVLLWNETWTQLVALSIQTIVKYTHSVKLNVEFYM